LDTENLIILASIKLKIEINYNLYEMYYCVACSVKKINLSSLNTYEVLSQMTR
jgi:hypothetical protein